MILVNKVSSPSSCIIANSTFTHNTAYFDPNGGGISMVFNGNACSNTVQLDWVHIANNNGSGICLVFKGDTNGNNVIMVLK